FLNLALNSHHYASKHVNAIRPTTNEAMELPSRTSVTGTDWWWYLIRSRGIGERRYPLVICSARSLALRSIADVDIDTSFGVILRSTVLEGEDARVILGILGNFNSEVG
ncbi:MAG: hypothetical protein L6R42_008365, partial [Xanthoria sp. 1 TBL-2021]